MQNFIEKLNRALLARKIGDGIFVSLPSAMIYSLM